MLLCSLCSHYFSSATKETQTHRENNPSLDRDKGALSFCVVGWRVSVVVGDMCCIQKKDTQQKPLNCDHTHHTHFVIWGGFSW